MEHNRGHKALLELGYELSELSGLNCYQGTTTIILFYDNPRKYQVVAKFESGNVPLNHVDMKEHKAIHLWLEYMGWIDA